MEHRKPQPELQKGDLAAKESWERPQIEQQEYAPEVISIEDDTVPPEIKDRIVENGLDLFRGIFSGIDDYSIFASTALFLQGKKHHIDMFRESPGDLDVNVHSKHSLDRIFDRLAQVPGIQFDFPKKGEGAEDRYFVSNLDGALILRGEIHMDTQDGTYSYPFEVFCNSSLVPSQDKDVRKVGGLQVLTLEALRTQYAKNLDLEKRFDASIRAIEQFLLSGEVLEGIEKGKDPFVALMDTYGVQIETLQERLDLEEQDMKDLYVLHAKMMAAGGNAEDPKYRKGVEQTLSRLKTKIAKRLRDVNRLDALVHGKDVPEAYQ